MQEGKVGIKVKEWALFWDVLHVWTRPSEPTGTKAGLNLTLLCVNTCSSKSLRAQTERKAEQERQTEACGGAACWYLQIRGTLAWMVSWELKALNEVRNKRPTTSQTFSDDTDTAGTGWPGGSERSGVGEDWPQRGEASLFVCPLAHQLGVCQRLYHFSAVLHSSACLQRTGGEKRLSSRRESMASSHLGPAAALRHGIASSRGSRTKV